MITRSPLRFLAALLLVAAIVPAHAKLFIIFDTTDSTNVTSLRGAILEANRLRGHHDIFLPKPSYRLTLTGPFEDAARTGDLDITASITIYGTSGHGSTISAWNLGDRVFDVASRGQLTLQNINIAGGTGAVTDHFTTHPDGSFSITVRDIGAGGGILNSGVLILKNCYFSVNVSANGFHFSGNLGDGPGAPGGAIFNGNSLTMEDCLIDSNSTGVGSNGGDGAGICNFSLAVIKRCTITGNACHDGRALGESSGDGGSGGGIYNRGRMLLNDTLIGPNSTGSGSPGSQGGFHGTFCGGDSGGRAGDGAGIYNSGTLTINRCSIDHNACGNGGDGAPCFVGGRGGPGGNGGGIFNSGNLILNTCTISENKGGKSGNNGPSFGGGGPLVWGGQGGHGGGLYNTGKAVITSATICLNIAGEAGNGAQRVPGMGGGIFAFSGSVIGVGGTNSVSVRNSLISLNTGSGDAKEIAGEFTSLGYNLIGASDGSSGFVNGVRHDLVGSEESYLDPLIASLEVNGGRTSTHALLPGSPAIDQGKHFDSGADQRGKKRPYNFPNIPNAPGGDGTDIGAFELTP